MPARTIRSAQEILLPYFCLIGQSNRRALSRLALSGQLFRGAKRCVPYACAAAAVGDAIGPGTVPGHPNEQRTVVAVVGRPPVLGRRHQLFDVLLQGIQVELLELLGVIEILAHRIALGRVLMKDLQVQLIRPPVPVRHGPGRRVSVGRGAMCRPSPGTCCPSADGPNAI